MTTDYWSLNPELFVECFNLSINEDGQLFGTTNNCLVTNEYISAYIHTIGYDISDSKIEKFIQKLKNVCFQQERFHNGTRKEL